MTKDLDRQELIQAIRDGRLTPEKIADLPVDQRLLAELLRAFPVAGADHLVDAPETVIRNAEAIFSPQRQLGRIQSLVAKLVFDSWAMPLPAGVRGGASTDERRLRFDLPPYVFDLRIERQGSQYYCVAEVAGAGLTPGNFTLLADAKPVSAGPEGLFEWSSTRPPRRLVLRQDDQEPLNLPELSWTKPRQK